MGKKEDLPSAEAEAWQRLREVLALLPGWEHMGAVEDAASGIWTVRAYEVTERHGKYRKNRGLVARGATEAKAVDALALLVEARVGPVYPVLGPNGEDVGDR
jgi:hypothetical protein